jgi:hypothetical protein
MSPFDEVHVCACYSAAAGEAETGSGGDQPDQGITGRNSSADDEKERDPPGAFFDLSPGPTSGRRDGPASGFGFDLVFALETPSDQKDSAMPQKTHTGRPVLIAAGIEWRGRDRRKCSRAVKSPGLPAGCAEHFPV